MRLALIVFALAAASQPATESTGAVRGRVVVKREPSAPRLRLTPTALGLDEPRSQPDRRRSVVYLQQAPQAAFGEPSEPRATLDQRDETFVPYVLAIRAGTRVDFPNNDRTYHNVFSLSKAARFDLGRYGAGHSKSVRFDRPGVVRVFCDIHSHMSAFILVFAHRYFATTARDGSYRIDDVPPGTYTLVVWNDGEDRETRSVRVAAGAESQVDFELR